MRRFLAFLVGLVLAISLRGSAAPPVNCVDIASPADLSHLADPSCTECALKLEAPALSAADLDRVTQWIRAGHCALVFDCNLAEKLGFKAAPVTVAHVQLTSTSFGGAAHPLAVFDASTTGNHPAISGLTTVTVAALVYPDGKVSAVAPGKDVTPLITTADAHEIIAAVHPMAKGYVVFKPFVLTNANGTRFTDQLDGWVATVTSHH